MSNSEMKVSGVGVMLLPDILDLHGPVVPELVGAEEP